jgi:hypothetical protein
MDIGIIIFCLVPDLSEPLDQIYDSNLFPGLVVDAGKV